MKKNYYDENKHGYMRYENDKFARYIFSLIPKRDFSKFSNVIEFGAGMGRFSWSLINNFSQVTLVEPVPAHIKILRDSFPQNNVQIFESNLQEFIERATVQNPLVFCFHLLHHLSPEHRGILYNFIRNTQGKAVFVEPNPWNPLILIQILIHPHMSLAEEQQYLTLTPSRYRRELSEHGLSLISYKRVCPLPPFITNYLLNLIGDNMLRNVEFIAQYIPFLASYQILVCGL